MGAWIEIKITHDNICHTDVASFVGAWIEISLAATTVATATVSLPLWERGLKLIASIIGIGIGVVASFVGAWIEICYNNDFSGDVPGRFLCGSVD